MLKDFIRGLNKSKARKFYKGMINGKIKLPKRL